MKLYLNIYFFYFFNFTLFFILFRIKTLIYFNELKYELRRRKKIHPHNF